MSFTMLALIIAAVVIVGALVYRNSKGGAPLSMPGHGDTFSQQLEASFEIWVESQKQAATSRLLAAAGITLPAATATPSTAAAPAIAPAAAPKPAAPTAPTTPPPAA